jgi:uncharacterized metal-binding protein
MVDLPKKKVGIVACSGEELAEGTVTRLAALKVLEQLRPTDTVTICLPLFLAGGEGDRAFARFYPTIAVDGCELRCAARGTEMYSGNPALSLVVSELIKQKGLEQPCGLRKLNQAGLQVVEVLADQIAQQVDQILDRPWDRRKGEFELQVLTNANAAPSVQATVQATCSCGSGIPVQKVVINGQEITLIALPVILQQFKEAGKSPGEETLIELLDVLKIYNAIPSIEEPVYREMLRKEYSAYFEEEHPE